MPSQHTAPPGSVTDLPPLPSLPDRQGTSVLSPSIPLALVVVPAFVIYRKSLQNVYETHPVLYVIAFATVASKVTCKLVVSGPGFWWVPVGGLVRYWLNFTRTCAVDVLLI